MTTVGLVGSKYEDDIKTHWTIRHHRWLLESLIFNWQDILSTNGDVVKAWNHIYEGKMQSEQESEPWRVVDQLGLCQGRYPHPQRDAKKACSRHEGDRVHLDVVST